MSRLVVLMAAELLVLCHDTQPLEDMATPAYVVHTEIVEWCMKELIVVVNDVVTESLRCFAREM